MSDDAALLSMYADQKNEAAFAELVQRHLGMVYAVALRTVGGDAHLARDVAQEVFTDLARKAPALCRHPCVGGWLFISTRFAAAKSVRRDRQRRAVLERLNTMKEAFAPDLNDYSPDELRPLIDDVIHTLNTRDREAILLRFYENQTFGEIGTQLRLSENAARMCVDRALEKMRATLKRRGVSSTTAALTMGLGGQLTAQAAGSLVGQITAGALTHTATVGSIFLYTMAMTTSKAGLTAALALAGLGIFAGEQFNNNKMLREQVNTLQAELNGYKDRVFAEKAQLVASQATVDEMTAQLERLKGADKNGSTSSARNQGMVVVHLRDVIRDHPEFAALNVKERRRNVLMQFKAGIAALNLLPEQSSHLKDLLEERAAVESDAQQAALAAGVPRNSPEMDKASNQARKPLDVEIANLIGTEAFDRLQASVGMSSFSFSKIDRLTSDLEDIGLKPSKEQAQSLQEIYYRLNSAQLNPDAGKPDYTKPDLQTWLARSDQQFLAGAAALLAPTQLTVLRSAIAENNQYEHILDQYKGPRDGMMITE